MPLFTRRWGESSSGGVNTDLSGYDALVNVTGNQKDGFTETTDNSKVAISSARLVLDETVTDL